MKMPKHLVVLSKRLKAARSSMPKRSSADAYAQLDQFQKATGTDSNGESSNNGANKLS